MWENSLEKLKILNYEVGFCKKKGFKPFSRIHFVYPGKNPGTQSDEFYALCSWLFTEATRNSSIFKKDEYDDPNTTANKLLVALRQLDFKLSVPIQKIKASNGEAVCSILEFLTDKAIDSANFKFGQPVYMESEEVQLFITITL
jgi:estrogen-related receptor beta like 1